MLQWARSSRAADTDTSGRDDDDMDAFKVHEALIEDYRKFTEGFVDIRDERISESVRAQAARGAQWPDPRMSLNPSFESGGTVGDLAVIRVS